MRAEPFSLGGMPALRWGRPSRRGILYLHGQGGSKAEAAFFAAAAADAGWQTVSVDLPGHGDRESEAAALVPWQVVPELRCALAELRGRWVITSDGLMKEMLTAYRIGAAIMMCRRSLRTN